MLSLTYTRTGLYNLLCNKPGDMYNGQMHLRNWLERRILAETDIKCKVITPGIFFIIDFDNEDDMLIFQLKYVG